MVSDTAGQCVINSPQLDCNFLKDINAKLDALIADKNSKGELRKVHALNYNSIFCAQTCKAQAVSSKFS